MEEEWRPVVGYEGLYEVSNLGRVRSLDKIVSNTNGCKPYLKRGKILNLPVGSNGYLHVSLYKNGSAKICNIHRIVAEAFIPNPLGLPIINHKDETKTNNSADNLEWCTYLYNNHYGDAIKKKAESNRGKKRKYVPHVSKRRPVYKYDINFNLVTIYNSVSEAVDVENSSFGNINLAIRMGTIRCGGYYWSHNDPKTVDTSFFKKSRFVNKWGLRGDNNSSI